MSNLNLPNSVNVLQEAMLQYERQMTVLRKAMDVGSPFQQIQDAMRRIPVPDYGAELRKAMAATAALNDPFRQIQDALKASQSQLFDSLRVVDPFKDLQAALATARIHDPFREMQAAITRWRLDDPTAALQRAFRDLRFEDVRRSIGPEAWPEAHDAKAPEAEVKVLGEAELRQLLDEVVEKALARSDSRVEIFVAKLVQEIRSLRNPLHEKLLTWVVFPILVALIFSIVNPVADYYVKEALAENERQAKKDIKAQVQTIAVEPTIKSFRFVSRTTLSVHQNPRAKSPVIGSLTLGRAVLLVEKRDDWSLVAWTSEDGQARVQGWVYSRYLEKFA